MSRLVVPEVASALAARTRSGQLSAEQRDALWRLFRVDLTRQYRVLQLADAVWERATQLLFRYTLRAADALHLASALTASGLAAQPLEFWTADERQALAAREEGLAVEFLA